MIENTNRLAGENGLGEEPRRHIGPAPRPIDGKEAQARARYPIEMRVAVSHQLVGLLGRRIKRLRRVHAILDGEGQFGVPAIDRGGTGKDQMLQPGAVPTCLEYLELALDIGGDVGMRINQRMAHAGLGRQVDDAIDIGMTVKESAERAALGKLETMEGEALLSGQSREP